MRDVSELVKADKSELSLEEGNVRKQAATHIISYLSRRIYMEYYETKIRP